ncbi:MAG: CBS domain-containing protein [Deltaproteobacteria bacterium]|nr:CBS domain-containing protein [Deltaproteobacteria bacterium]
MPTYKGRSVISGMVVQEAMRCVVNRINVYSSIESCIQKMIRQKSNAVLAETDDGKPVGVVSKTDIINAYYAALPVHTPVSDILSKSPYFCNPSDKLDMALDLMIKNKIHRIYIREKNDDVIGTLSYSDIVGLLYRYCRKCEKGKRNPGDLENRNLPRLMVNDVMTSGLIFCDVNDRIIDVIETLFERRLGAVLVKNGVDAIGVISKTDLIISYGHGQNQEINASNIITMPVLSCSSDILLSEAVQKMFIHDVQRLFVSDHTDNIIGVISLSDAAKARSGTCKACAASVLLEGVS